MQTYSPKILFDFANEQFGMVVPNDTRLTGFFAIGDIYKFSVKEKFILKNTESFRTQPLRFNDTTMKLEAFVRSDGTKIIRVNWIIDHSRVITLGDIMRKDAFDNYINILPDELLENTDPNDAFEKLNGVTIECLGTKKCEMRVLGKKEFTTKDVFYWKVDLKPIVSRSFPSITQYINAITIPESFATKSTLRPVLKDDGTPYFSAGGYAVVFKMQCEESGKYFALKCFIREQTKRAESFQKISDYLNYLDSPYLVPYEYLENELWVEDADFPVLLMEWVEGETLDHRLAILCHQNDQQGIATLAETFDTLGLWLLEEELAHGDVKPDNIIIRPSGQPVLIDYDGMFVPSMIGEQSREKGTQNWRHPKRTATDFNRHLDDFSILVISLSLQIFKEKPGFYHPTGNADNLLFTEADYLNPQASEAFRQVIALQSNNDIASRLSLLQYAVSLPVLQLIGIELQLKKMASEVDDLPLTTTYDPSEGEYIDEYGVKYNAARTKLVKGPTTYTGEIDDNGIVKYFPTTVEIPNSVISIVDHAFSNCKYITSIIIPNNVILIGYSAFSKCENLTSIIISNNIKCIERDAFYGCEKLTSIKIPRGIQSIEEGIFFGCTNLISVEIPDDVAFIGDQAFENCTELLLINIPKSVKRIGARAFFNCENLTSIKIPNSVTSIGASAFCSTKLDSILLPNNLTLIENSVFSGCSNLMSIDIPQSVTSIGHSAFNGCSNLVSIILPESITLIENFAFSGCTNLIAIELPNEVTAISDFCFYHCNKLSSVKISDSITVIGNSAFKNCTSLTSIEIPKSVRSIGSFAFRGSNLTTITIPDSILLIGHGAFCYCKKLISIIIPNSVTWIGDGAFCYCENLTSIIISNSITSIGDGTFLSCENIVTIELPSGVTSIKEDAFRFCKKLTSIIIPNGVTKIGKRAFFYCENLTYIEIPDSVAEIEDNAFGCCQSIAEGIRNKISKRFGEGVLN